MSRVKRSVEGIVARLLQPADAGACAPNAFECCGFHKQRDCNGNCNLASQVCLHG
jgi:hypothetical protein